MYTLKAGIHCIRTRSRFYELKLSQDAFIIDHERGPWAKYENQDMAWNNRPGDWTIDINGHPRTICTNGPFRLKRWQLRAVK